MAVVLPTPLPRTVATPGIFRELDVTGNDGLNPPPVLGTAVLSGAAPLTTPPPNRDLSVDLVVNRISRLPDGRVSGTRDPDRSNNFLSAILSPPPAVTPTPRVSN
jgi:hypothetical protein